MEQPDPSSSKLDYNNDLVIPVAKHKAVFEVNRPSQLLAQSFVGSDGGGTGNPMGQLDQEIFSESDFQHPDFCSFKLTNFSAERHEELF